MTENNRIEKYLDENGYILQTVFGISMEPMLHDRRSLVKIEKTDGLLKKYDVALFHRPNNRKNYVLHRVMKVGKHDYIIRGDNCANGEKVPHDWVIGVLTEFSRDGEDMTPVTDEEYLRYVREHCGKYFWQDCKRLPGRCIRKAKRLLKR